MQVCKVQFKEVGKRYFFNPNGILVSDGLHVVVETIRGLELGVISGDLVEIENPEIEVKNVVRIATNEDIKIYEQNKVEALEVVKKTKEEVSKLNLDMKVLEAEYILDKTKLIIYFESEGRVDFRDLVKVLAEIYHVRIELRQVGSRDGAKVFGGIGPCGLIVCCKTFITEFDTITVKMAKNQNLALNPVKISGNCGKLLCCIGYEDETYKELRKTAPDIGDIVEAPEGSAKVLACDPLNRTCKVKYIGDNEKFAYLSLDDIKFTKREKNKE